MTLTATETPASARLCRKAARIFTLSFDCRQTSAAVARSTSSAKPAKAMTSPPATCGGSASRPMASTASQIDTAISAR